MLSVEVVLLSGEQLAFLEADVSWTGRRLKAALRPYVDQGVRRVNLVFFQTGRVLEDDEMLNDHGCDLLQFQAVHDIRSWKHVDLRGDGKWQFKVPDHFELLKLPKRGGFGATVSFTDKRSNRNVLVTQEHDAFFNIVDARRIAHEVLLQTHLFHDNILPMLDVYTSTDSPDFGSIYMVTPHMNSDLGRVMASKLTLTHAHHTYLTYQIFCGLRYMHSAGVVHRDLNPAHVLVSKDCRAMITGFGRACGMTGEGLQGSEADTGRVDLSCYKPPEALLEPSLVSGSFDIWSVGCIVGELVNRRPVFKAVNYLDKVRTFVRLLGKPSDQDLQWLPDGPCRNFVRAAGGGTKQAWRSSYPEAKALASEVMEATLRFDPARRASAEECLAFPVFVDCRDPLVDEPPCDVAFDWSMLNSSMTRRELEHLVYTECC